MVLFDKDIGRIKFQYHLESRNDNELTEAFPVETFGKSGKNGFSSFDWDFVRPRLLLSLGNFNFIVEGRDFKIMPDGSLDIFCNHLSGYSRLDSKSNLECEGATIYSRLSSPKKPRQLIYVLIIVGVNPFCSTYSPRQ